jgi:hypothetical protein
MKCFDVVRTVLDATYDEVPGDEKKRDKNINAALEAMSEQYKTKLMAEGGPDFDDPVTRFGYVLRYVPAHAHWLYDLLTECPEAAAVFKSGKARVTCIGGGPGSDIVGLLKFLDEEEIKCKLFCELIDGCEGWKSTWGDLAFQLDLDEALHTDYVIHDVGDESTWESPSKIHKADVISLSFFVSEIFHLDEAEEYLITMLSKAKAGALLLMTDNRTADVYNLMDEIAEDADFKKLKGDEGVKKIYDPGEDMALIKKYRDKFGASKLTGNLSWRIYQRT